MKHEVLTDQTKTSRSDLGSYMGFLQITLYSTLTKDLLHFFFLYLYTEKNYSHRMSWKFEKINMHHFIMCNQYMINKTVAATIIADGQTAKCCTELKVQ